MLNSQPQPVAQPFASLTCGSSTPAAAASACYSPGRRRAARGSTAGTQLHTTLHLSNRHNSCGFPAPDTAGATQRLYTSCCYNDSLPAWLCWGGVGAADQAAGATWGLRRLAVVGGPPRCRRGAAPSVRCQLLRACCCHDGCQAGGRTFGLRAGQGVGRAGLLMMAAEWPWRAGACSSMQHMQILDVWMCVEDRKTCMGSRPLPHGAACTPSIQVVLTDNLRLICAAAYRAAGATHLRAGCLGDRASTSVGAGRSEQVGGGGVALPRTPCVLSHRA